MTTQRKVLVGIGLALVAYAIYRRLGTDRTVEADIATNQDGTVTEYTVIGCTCYRVDNLPDGSQQRTVVDRGFCAEDFKSASLAHCGGA